MINFLPLEISITKYQTFSSELLETLNQYVKCQQDITKYIPCAVKEHSPEYSHCRMLQPLPRMPPSEQAVSHHL